MSLKSEIVICLGSSCFSRGNKKTVQIIKDYLKQNNLENEVYFHGNHCFNKCADGPILKINEKIYEHVSSENVISILNAFFGK